MSARYERAVVDIPAVFRRDTGAPLATASSNERQGLAELQGLLLSTSSLDEFLNYLVVLAVRTLDAVGAAGVTLQPDRRPRTVASSDEVATRVDEVQYHHEEGPCLEALATDTVVDIPDLSAETRFRKFTANALALGVRSVLSLPLAGPDAHTVGALTLYSFYPRAYQQATCEQAQTFAGNAAGAIAVALRMANQAELTDNLRTALDSRTVIDQALGILMAQQRCGAEEAFAILRSASQHRNVKLRQVAAEVVESVAGEPPPAQANFRS